MSILKAKSYCFLHFLTLTVSGGGESLIALLSDEILLVIVETKSFSILNSSYYFFKMKVDNFQSCIRLFLALFENG